MNTKHKNIMIGLSFSLLVFATSCDKVSDPTITGVWSADVIKVNHVDVTNSAPYHTNVKGEIKEDHTFISSSNFDTNSGFWQQSEDVLTVYLGSDTIIYNYYFPDNTHLNLTSSIAGNYVQYKFSK